MADYKESLAELGKNNQNLFSSTGSTGKAFGQLHHAALEDGALDYKTKELLALAIAVAIRCEGCIVSHANSAVQAGASYEEISEVVSVAIMMGGGPSVVYGGKALQCAKEFLG